MFFKFAPILALCILLASCASKHNSRGLASAMWSDIDFGQLPLTKDFSINGELKSGMIFSKKAEFSLNMDKDFIKDDVRDQYYANKSFHWVRFNIEGVQCKGVSFLSTEDEMGKGIMYSMTINYDKNGRSKNCPYQVQLDFGDMEEDFDEVYTVLTVYPSNDLSKKKKYKGVLQKD